jgi:hypothetical protein
MSEVPKAHAASGGLDSSLDAYAARAMTKPFRSRSARVALLALVAVALLVLASRVTWLEPRRASTQIQRRGIAQWEVGWKPLVFCSEQTASVRGWRANLGPLVVTRLRTRITNLVVTNGDFPIRMK